MNIRFFHIPSLLLAVALLAGCSPKAGPKPRDGADGVVPITLGRVELAALDRVLPVVGTLGPRNEATVAAQVEGQVQRTAVDFGDRVTAGQELAHIDTDSYQAQNRQVEANLTRAKASLQNAESQLKRIQALQQDRISSASELDAATAQAEQARAEVKAMEATLAVARLNLDRSRVRAPFTAAVTERVANAGDYVKTGAPLFRLVDDEELKYLVQVPERDAARVKPGQRIEFTVDAWPGEVFSGEVYLVSPAVNAATRSFNVAARVPNPGGKLKANTYARGQLVIERAVPTRVVPIDAVVTLSGISRVFVVTNQAARARVIRTGRVASDRFEVVEGLAEGEEVAVSGAGKLFEGARVRLQPAAPAPSPEAR